MAACAAAYSVIAVVFVDVVVPVAEDDELISGATFCVLCAVLGFASIKSS